jgi:hypothetical protein
MGSIGGIEEKILKKYDNGRIIDSEDRLYVEKLANTGLVNIGYSPKYKKLTAKTTSLAHAHIF